MDQLTALRTLLPNSFRNFVKHFWDVVSPDSLLWGPHLDALCEHLQGVATGKIDNLLVNMPPRCSKSLTAVVLFPVWMWVRDPSERVIHGSYSKKLSVEHAVLSRKLIESDQFRRLFGHVVLSDDSNAKDGYGNSAGGQRLSVSVGSATTGFNASVILVDDLHSVAEKESEVERKSAIDYYRLSISSRAIRGRRVPRIVLGHRVHQDDVSGWIEDHFRDDPSWTFLSLPLEYDPERVPLRNAIGWRDWRTQAGEILWPEAFTPEQVAAIKIEYRHDFQCLHNQNPVDKAGNLFKLEWFRHYDTADDVYTLDKRFVRASACSRIASVDFAATVSGSSDYTVMTVADLSGQDVIIRHVERGRFDGTKIVPRLKAVYDAYRPSVVLCERAGQQQVLIDQLRAAGVPVRAIRPVGDKETRSIPLQVKFEAGQVWFPKGPGWVVDAEKELLAFPGRHDDIVDSMSQLISAGGRYAARPELSEDERAEREKTAQAKHWRSMLMAGVED